ncbi:hypothetical protein A9G25_02135 [Gilliamella sp. Bif1-4]|nr:hypothetical protein A9G25_02135 [Gilliamella apicola]
MTYTTRCPYFNTIIFNRQKNIFDSLVKTVKYLGQAAKLMVGIADYDNYVQHIKLTHPDQTPMT